MLSSESPDDTPQVMPWVGMYAGIMMIMLAFFLALFCTGQTRRDDTKFKAGKHSVAGALGSPRNLVKEPPPDGTGTSVPLSELERLIMGPGVTIYRIRHGMAVAVPGSFLFLPDGITPAATSREILDKVVAYARCGNTRIAVECCAMDAQERSGAWDTSVRRAMAVGNYLVSHGVASARICPIGMGRTADSLEQDAGNNVIISFFYE